MKTVKEVSQITGISIRTLHYYDEIGLLRPTALSEAGYRFYDEQALETLQQILFFREFDIPLKDIKAILENPELDRNQMLKSQKRMLELKRERLTRMISSIDDILKGVNRMDFAVFDRSELEEMYQGMVSNMSEDYKARIVEKFGSMEEYQKQFLESAAGEKAQKNFQKVVEWYGDKEDAMNAVKNPKNQQLFPAYQRRLEAIIKKLAEKMGKDVHSFEVKEMIGEYEFVTKQMYQMKDAKSLILELAALYERDEKARQGHDSVYGAGSAAFFAQAVEAFYQER